MINKSPLFLIFGLGYTGMFLAKKMSNKNMRVVATVRSKFYLDHENYLPCEPVEFSASAIEPILAQATHLLISIPPASDIGDQVLANFSGLLKHYAHKLDWLGYLSSTGVYGDHQGDWVDETSLPRSPSSQGQLRLLAESQWTSFAVAHDLPLTIFRLAGIYGPKRNTLVRLQAGKRQTIIKPGHFFSRIYVDDLVSAIVTAIFASQSGVNIYNIADDQPEAGYIVDDYAASLLQLPLLEKIPYDRAILSPMAKEFYSHNKRVLNSKLKDELGLRLAYPTYKQGLKHLFNGEALP
ncbi:MAG: SDR family oxidoreductase [Legionella sp.]